jgi:probable HAF family extracellular repeat protein
MQNLNDLIPADSGWVLSEAHGINDAGQIVGVGTVGGLFHAFLLTPATPEPSGAAMALIAAIALLSGRQRRFNCRASR